MILAQGDRLCLRSLRTSDLADFLEYRTDPKICRYQGFEIFDKNKAIAFIAEQCDKNWKETGQWTQIGISKIADDRLIGDCALLFKTDEPRIAEIGISISSSNQGKGFATEVVKLLIEMVFTQKDTHKITAKVDERNLASIRLLQKLGFRCEAKFIENYFDQIDRKWYSEFQFYILNSEYKMDYNNGADQCI